MDSKILSNKFFKACLESLFDFEAYYVELFHRDVIINETQKGPTWDFLNFMSF